MDAFEGVKAVSLLAADERTATANGTGADIAAYHGRGLVVADVEAGGGTTPTCDIKLQDSADNSTFADITGATFAQVTDAAALFDGIAVNLDNINQYLRAVITITGTSPTFVSAVTLIAAPETGPASN